jgi:hypothetical protein
MSEQCLERDLTVGDALHAGFASATGFALRSRRTRITRLPLITNGTTVTDFFVRNDQGFTDDLMWCRPAFGGSSTPRRFRFLSTIVVPSISPSSPVR